MKFVNRRKRHPQYLLEVKVHTQGRWRRRTQRLLAVAFTLAVVFLIGYGSYRLCRFTVNRLVYQNPRFTITRVTVENDGVLTPPRVMQFAGVRPGQNLLAVDLGHVRRNLEMIPMVRQVEVRRQMPNQLVIRLQERVPVARLHVPSRGLSDTVFLIDRAGVVMKPLKLDDGTVLMPQMPRPVPVLTGVTLADVRIGRTVESPQIHRALELLEQLAECTAGSLLEVERVDLGRPRELVLITRQQTAIRFDVEQFPQQLRRLAVILAWAQQRQKLVRQVDLTVSRSVPVTLTN